MGARSRPMLLGIVTIAVAVVAIVAAASGTNGRAGEPPPQSAEVAALFRGIPQHGRTLGDPHAPVTLFEFADLKCPICRAYSLQVLPTLLREYVRPGRLKIVFQAQTFVGSPPGDSERAARAALAAGMQDKLWQFAELWYYNQGPEGAAYATDAHIRRIAAGVPGLDVDRVLAERSSPRIGETLREASGLFHTGGFAGTPGFALGLTGEALRPLPATVRREQFTGPIDRLLASLPPGGGGAR